MLNKIQMNNNHDNHHNGKPPHYSTGYPLEQFLLSLLILYLYWNCIIIITWTKMINKHNWNFKLKIVQCKTASHYSQSYRHSFFPSDLPFIHPTIVNNRFQQLSSKELFQSNMKHVLPFLFSSNLKRSTARWMPIFTSSPMQAAWSRRGPRDALIADPGRFAEPGLFWLAEPGLLWLEFLRL